MIEEFTLKQKLRVLHLADATGSVLRTEMLHGREHIVVPVVALMEGVIHAVNAETPEFVPADTLKRAAESWNGRPITLGHPTRNGKQCSANDPNILASHGIGTIFNSRVVGTKMLQEAWVDKLRLKQLDPNMLQRLLASENNEVSVGAFVISDKQSGHFNGKPYLATWLETTGDHLAFLPSGPGACSVAMGCGTHRAASMKALGPLADNSQVVVEGSMKVGDMVQVNKPDHAANGKKGRITSSAKGGTVHTVGDLGTFHQSNLKAAESRALQTPEEDAAEEAAELVGYNLLRTHLDSMGTAWDKASALVDALIADETENPTETPAQEDAEEEVEAARLDAIMSLMSTIAGSASLIMSSCIDMNSEDPPEATAPRYMGAKDCPMCKGSGNVAGNPCEVCDGVGQLKAAAGARHSLNDMQMVQSIHDQAQALGASCTGYKSLRDISQKERDATPDADFAGKGTSFPIKKPEDVAAAAHSLGRAGADNYSSDTIKANIIRIAYRKGASFVAQLPEAWKKKADQKAAAAHDPNRSYIETVSREVRR